MKNRVLLIFVIVFLVVNVIFLMNVNKRMTILVDSLEYGGIALVNNYSEISSFKRIIQANLDKEKSYLDSIACKTFEEEFYLYTNKNSKGYSVLLISKSKNDIVYYIDNKNVIFYDKIYYSLDHDLMLNLRIKFYKWLKEQGTL